MAFKKTVYFSQNILVIFWHLKTMARDPAVYFPRNRAPRSARRARKPLQDDWNLTPRKGVWLKCTYVRCSYEWEYFGGHKWAECPICHSGMKVAVAKRNYNNLIKME